MKRVKELSKEELENLDERILSSEIYGKANMGTDGINISIKPTDLTYMIKLITDRREYYYINKEKIKSLMKEIKLLNQDFFNELKDI